MYVWYYMVCLLYFRIIVVFLHTSKTFLKQSEDKIALMAFIRAFGGSGPARVVGFGVSGFQV